MKEASTKYGILNGISSVELFPNGMLKECKLNEYNEIVTSYGTFVPRFEENEIRKKYTSSISFYDNGNIRSIALNEQSSINMDNRSFPAERVLFYENGKVKKIFPLNGKLTGYWTEENEYALAEEFQLNFEFAHIKARIIAFQFYEDGNIKSLTLWPKETVEINTPFGTSKTRIGISLYNSGKLKSYEPRIPMVIDTPIGKITAYDCSANGINGDTNSLSFYENGKPKTLSTSSDKIEVINEKGVKTIFQPGLKPNLFNNSVMELVPLRLEFLPGRIRFNDESISEFEIENCSFVIERYNRNRI